MGHGRPDGCLARGSASLAGGGESGDPRGLPYLGLCLGHQLLAAALGGEVGPSKTPEIGILDVELTAAGQNSRLFAELPRKSPCLQWHSAEVTRAPQGASVLAASPACAVQALAWGPNAFGIQYHVEITGDTVAEWGAVPAYKAALESNLGPGALAAMDAEAAAHLPAFRKTARQLYDNYMDRLQ